MDGCKSCERMGATQALNHTKYQHKLEQKGHSACERMGATQALNHTHPITRISSTVKDNNSADLTAGFDWAVKMRIRPPELDTSICDVMYHVSLALSVIPRGSWGDVARRFTMIRWPPASSPLGRTHAPPSATHAPPPLRQTCSGHRAEEIPSVVNFSDLLVQTDKGIVIPVMDLIRRSTTAYNSRARIPCESGWSQAPRRQQGNDSNILLATDNSRLTADTNSDLSTSPDLDPTPKLIWDSSKRLRIEVHSPIGTCHPANTKSAIAKRRRISPNQNTQISRTQTSQIQKLLTAPVYTKTTNRANPLNTRNLRISNLYRAVPNAIQTRSRSQSVSAQSWSIADLLTPDLVNTKPD
ncbi:hypothetical protein F511_12319 [Dorcoceras hygrometricum]|uniref:Uncharacterized protein n=1 Tax=Dorcoceras hygrometricum TaxID=472368 RepID=A0A2Z7BK53_9LAMI|nr:hypothetical protein F511_12319 [Dorcoceras hygrometricum]